MNLRTDSASLPGEKESTRASYKKSQNISLNILMKLFSKNPDIVTRAFS